MLGEDLGVDRFRCAPVLARQPVIGQVQVDPGRLDRGVPGLGLDRLQSHPRFAQPGQTGVPQLVAGRVREPGPPACTVEDFIDAISRKRPPAAGTFQRHEQRVRATSRGPFAIQVGADRGEEPARDRHDPLMPAFAVGDEHPPLPECSGPATEDRVLRSGATHQAPSPTPSLGLGACESHAAAHQPRPAPESAATFATCGPAAHLGVGVEVHAASATHAAPGSNRCHRGHANSANSPDTLDNRRRTVRDETPVSTSTDRSRCRHHRRAAR